MRTRDEIRETFRNTLKSLTLCQDAVSDLTSELSVKEEDIESSPGIRESVARIVVHPYWMELGIGQDVTKLIGDTWSYGYSSVTFRDDKVSSYSNISNNLRVR